MQPFLLKLKAFAQHPLTQLVTGLVLLITGLTQAIDDILHAEHRFRLGVHHGVLLLGLVQVLGSLPSIVEGLDRYFRSLESRERKEHSSSKEDAEEGKPSSDCNREKSNEVF